MGVINWWFGAKFVVFLRTIFVKFRAWEDYLDVPGPQFRSHFSVRYNFKKPIAANQIHEFLSRDIQVGKSLGLGFC